MFNIRGLDGLRALAIIFVVQTHLHLLKNIDLKEFSLLIHGTVGVKIFFVISGFLITNSFIFETQRKEKLSIRNFYIRRTIRLFPLYFLCLFILTLLIIFGINIGNNQYSIPFAWFYSYNFVPKIFYAGVLGHTWALAVMEQFYLFWPIVFYRFSKNKKMLLFGCTLYLVICYEIHLMLINSSLNDQFFISRWLIPASAGIIVGVFFSLLNNQFQQNRFYNFLVKSKISLILSILLYSGPILFVEYLGYMNVSYLMLIGIGIGIAWICNNQSSFLVNILESIPFKYIGIMSYSIYIWQGFFLSTGPYRSPGQVWPPNQSTGFILLVITVPFSYYCIEKKFLRYKSFFK